MGSRRRVRSVLAARTASVLVLTVVGACRSEPKIPKGLLESLPPSPTVLSGDHVGPGVTAGTSGTARFARVIHARFDPARALEETRFVDRFYRAPANEGFDLVLDHVAERLRAAGFGSKDGFELEFLSSELTSKAWMQDRRSPAEAWTPLRARLALVDAAGAQRVLHAFEKSEDVDRVMLPINAPSADVSGGVALGLDSLDAGEILVTTASPVPNVLKRAHELGAKAVISSYLEAYNADPSPAQRDTRAIQFSSVPYGTPIPVARISPASFEAIRAACERAPETRLAFSAEVRFEQKPLRTLVARVVGRDRPQEAVAIASHVQEPGACDNATGVAGMLESAIGLVAAIEAGELPRPSRTLVFLWGDEFRQTSEWLAQTKLTPVAGLSSDMTGESRERTGAIALLERMPDPAAITPLEPDHHTPWGAGTVDPGSLRPNGVAIVARCAIHDVAALDGGWKTAEHPYEGGSDHDIFIAKGIPAALFWHFTDFAYHTSLDRMDDVDPSEMRRTAAALLATALALADPCAADLQRYLESLNEELLVRTRAAEKVQDEALAQSWRDWCVGARHWLRSECLRLPPPVPAEATSKP
ncbi:MAG: M28 family peptidase [Planctomycetes bacterium]|nr:M28 family peptidase [Planctomycetota bacterium]